MPCLAAAIAAIRARGGSASGANRGVQPAAQFQTTIGEMAADGGDMAPDQLSELAGGHGTSNLEQDNHLIDNGIAEQPT